MLTLLRTTSIFTLLGLQIILGSSGAKAWDLQEQPRQEASNSVSWVQEHPLDTYTSTQKKFEPDQDNGGPSRTSGAGGH